MARTVAEAAKALTDIHDEFFGNDLGEKYRISWERLRELCGVMRLYHPYLNKLSAELIELGFSLACFDDYILVMKESDCDSVRSVPGRIVDKYLPEDAATAVNELEEDSDAEEWGNE
jgi:hypothetical protein